MNVGMAKYTVINNYTEQLDFSSSHVWHDYRFVHVCVCVARFIGDWLDAVTL